MDDDAIDVSGFEAEFAINSGKPNLKPSLCEVIAIPLGAVSLMTLMAAILLGNPIVALSGGGLLVVALYGATTWLALQGEDNRLRRQNLREKLSTAVSVGGILALLYLMIRLRAWLPIQLYIFWVASILLLAGFATIWLTKRNFASWRFKRQRLKQADRLRSR